jgi:HSP20 family molecular chaperone IbpA
MENQDVTSTQQSGHTATANAPHASQYVPVTVYRPADPIAVAAPMAGSEPEDIIVEVMADNRIRLHGALRGVLKGDKAVLADEWNPEPYEREITLPVAVNGDLANVTYGNGVVVVALPVIEGTSRPARLTLETTGPAHGERAGNAGPPVQSLTAAEHRAMKDSAHKVACPL